MTQCVWMPNRPLFFGAVRGTLQVVRSTRSETREEFLRIGEELVLRERDVDAVSSMSAADLVALASRPLSRGAFTNHWPVRSSFDADLHVHVAEGIRLRAVERVGELLRRAGESIGEAPSLQHFISDAVGGVVQLLRESTDQAILIGLWSKAQHDDRLRQTLAESWMISERNLTAHLELLLAGFRLQMKPGLSLVELSAALVSVLDVSFIRAMVVGVDELDATMWSTMTVALANHYCEPIPLSE